MVRDLIIGSTVGCVGLVALVFGIQAYLDPGQALVPVLADPTWAAAAVGAGIICCLIELRIMLPVLRALAARNRQQEL
jgi:hypothetical protein